MDLFYFHFGLHKNNNGKIKSIDKTALPLDGITRGNVEGHWESADRRQDRLRGENGFFIGLPPMLTVVGSSSFSVVFPRKTDEQTDLKT